jgi:hypothetical protein
MMEALLAPLGALGAPLAASCPPAWLFVVLALPHVWYSWVLIHPASTKRTAALLKTDAMEWFAAVSLALNVAQFAALAAFVATTPGAFSAAGLAARLAAAPWRLLALPLFAAGSVLKVAIFRAIGKAGVYYGAKFGHAIPWVHGFPFSVTGALRAAPPRALRHCGMLLPATRAPILHRAPSASLRRLPRTRPAHARCLLC